MLRKYKRELFSNWKAARTTCNMSQPNMCQHLIGRQLASSVIFGYLSVIPFLLLLPLIYLFARLSPWPTLRYGIYHIETATRRREISNGGRCRDSAKYYYLNLFSVGINLRNTPQTYFVGQICRCRSEVQICPWKMGLICSWVPGEAPGKFAVQNTKIR